MLAGLVGHVLAGSANRRYYLEDIFL